MASIDFYINTGSDFNLLGGGSGLGFYGDGGFGYSVQVGAYQGRTYVTDGNGVTMGPESSNVKYLSANSGILGQTGSGIALTHIPNYQASMNIRFTNVDPVQVQNTHLYVYDRVSTSNPPSGVDFQVAELIHPSVSQAVLGSGDASWTLFGSGLPTSKILSASPGASGEYAGNGSGSVHTDTRHDFYLALSVSPKSIGSKTQVALSAYIEYL